MIVFTLVLFATFSTNQKQTHNQVCVAHKRFSTLDIYVCVFPLFSDWFIFLPVSVMISQNDFLKDTELKRQK